MASSVLTPQVLALTAALQDIPNTQPGAGKVRRYDVRFTNVGAGDTNAYLVLTDGTTVINRVSKYPVPFNSPNSAPDAELGLLVPAGWKLRAKADLTGTIEVSVTGVEDVA